MRTECGERRQLPSHLHLPRARIYELPLPYFLSPAQRPLISASSAPNILISAPALS